MYVCTAQVYTPAPCARLPLRVSVHKGGRSKKTNKKNNRKQICLEYSRKTTTTTACPCVRAVLFAHNARRPLPLPRLPRSSRGAPSMRKKKPHPKALGLCNVFGVSLPPFSERSDARTFVKLTEFHMLNRSLNLLHLSLSTRVHVCLLQTCLNRGQYCPQEARLNLWEFGSVPPLSSRPQACGRIYRPTLAFSLSLPPKPLSSKHSFVAFPHAFDHRLDALS